MNSVVKFSRILFNILLITFLLSCQTKHNSTNTVEKTLVKKVSPLTFEDTYKTIKDRVEKNPNLKLLFELDHSANASKNGLSLRPTKLLIFGNPKVGTPLMNTSPTLAIDLPQKIIIYKEKEKVYLTYNNLSYLRERHKITGKDALIKKISEVLDKITTIEK